MKFTLLALVATAAAIRITATEAPCVSMAQSDEVFHEVDTSGNGQISEKELTVAIKAYLKAHDLHPSKAQVKAFRGAAIEEAGADRQLSPVEFNALANEVCAYVEEHDITLPGTD